MYDLVGDKRVVKIKAHEDDINSCCWADTTSGNILVSASDDSFIKIWSVTSGCCTPLLVLITSIVGIVVP